MNWDGRAYEVWRAFVLGVRDQIKVKSGLTAEVNEQLRDAGQMVETSGYEILEMLDWAEAKIRSAIWPQEREAQGDG